MANSSQVRRLLCLGEFLCEEGPSTHAGNLIGNIRISEWGLRHSDLRSLRGIVKRLDCQRGVGGGCGCRHGWVDESR